MTVYLGTHGEIELKRVFNGGKLQATINAAANNTGDVNATEKRFGFDFNHGELLSGDLKHGLLLTGDQIEITTTDNTALDFIDSYTDSSVKKFIHVDELDGIRLYNSFAHAVSGGKANAIALACSGSLRNVEIIVESAAPRLLAQVSSFEINTERETVDTTVLSDEFRTRVNTLISGSGRITAFWEYTGDTANELPMYLYELAHRTTVGSNFIGRFYIKKAGYNPSGVAERNNDEVWWRVEGIITAAAIQFSPDSTVQITADFVTTGELRLRMDLDAPVGLLQEDNGQIRLDQDGAAKLGLQQQT
tara:strand:+ start:353 stop:1267 length:915 start_codon:yes stop_codon:yes gene_type:complete